MHGQQADVETLRENVAQVLAPLGLKLSPAKTTVVHMAHGFDFLGFRIQWKREGDQQVVRAELLQHRSSRGRRPRRPHHAAGHCVRPLLSTRRFSPLQSDALETVAEQLAATPMAVALAWLLQRSPYILLIPGTSSVVHLLENVAGAALELPADATAELDAIGRWSLRTRARMTHDRPPTRVRPAGRLISSARQCCLSRGIQPCR